MTDTATTSSPRTWPGQPDALGDAALFDVERPPPVSLADKFGMPPMSVLDRRSGVWQDRKRRWLSLGLQSELGRDEGLLYDGVDSVNRSVGHWQQDSVSATHAAYSGGVSVFDPVLCELVYRWFVGDGGRVLDPFAGGSVRGIVASTLGRYYDGVDLRGEQVDANEAQAALGSDIQPRWLTGDATRLDAVLEPTDEYDLVFTCPPYADLERYSDNPRDLSTMHYDDFLVAYREIIVRACARLRRNRFAAWVVSDVRDRRGVYRGLVADTIKAFQAAGLSLYNEAVILDQIGTAALRAERAFVSSRKLTRTHQVLLVFVKGDPRVAAAAVGAAQDSLGEAS